MVRTGFCRIALGLGVVGLVLAGLTATPAAAQEFTPGSAGLGDPYFPLAGNGGYDVGHYALDFSYDPFDPAARRHGDHHAPPRRRICPASTSTCAVSTSNRSVSTARAATFTRDGQELVITPAAGLLAGAAFTVVVGYPGVPSVVTDPDGSIEGWVPTDDGAFVVGEPQGSPAWYPANDNPRDKATYDFTDHRAGRDLTVMANGVLDVADDRWRPDHLRLARDLADGAVSGDRDARPLRSDGDHAAGGHPVVRGRGSDAPKGNVLRKLPDIVEFYSSIYGPYPFEAVGAIVDDAKEVGYSLETQTKPVFYRVPDEATLAHEISHMWFGDSVTLTEWPDIWLHEGFATWSEWIWSEHNGQKSAHHWFKTLYNTPAQDTAFWTPPPGDPGGPAFMFNGTIYNRGAMTLQALREKIGDTNFFEILREWAARTATAT